MRFQPQSIKLMERLDKKLALEWWSDSVQRRLASWREATGVSTRQEQTFKYDVSHISVCLGNPIVSGLISGKKTTEDKRTTKSTSCPLAAGDSGAFTAVSRWFGGWRSGQGGTEVSCCLVSQVKALSPWKQDWTCTDPTCLRAFSMAENVVYKHGLQHHINTHTFYTCGQRTETNCPRSKKKKRAADSHRKLQLKKRQCEKFNYLRK